MAKKDSGLGRGLGDLLFDNTPEIRTSGNVIKRDGDKEIYVDHGVKAEEISVSVVKNAGNYTEQTSKPHVFAAVEPITAKNESIVIEQLSIDGIEPTVITAGSNDDSSKKSEEAPVTPRRSLKAVFREFK